ncbi:MAG: dihydrofolate reductase family protein [Candidatus Pacebacteria bacterium]|nr:dihydrofolate reductase family protein [Candidatus Paceibacterota bacterium]
MRKLIVFSHLSLDGIAAIPSGNLNWISYDKDLQAWAETIVADTSTALYGRVTYELMKYWKTVPLNPDASKHDLEHARWIENVEKIVVSEPDLIPDWNNARVISENIEAEILKLKEQPGKNITVFGSPTVANLLIKIGLADEFQLSINPVILGDGKFLFKDINNTKLKLLEENSFASGVTTLHYQLIK